MTDPWVARAMQVPVREDLARLNKGRRREDGMYDCKTPLSQSIDSSTNVHHEALINFACSQ